MPKAKIVITINDEGNPTVEVQGCPGPSCQTLTRSLEDALGVVVEDRKTPEYYQPVVQSRVHLDQS